MQHSPEALLLLGYRLNPFPLSAFNSKSWPFSTLVSAFLYAEPYDPQTALSSLPLDSGLSSKRIEDSLFGNRRVDSAPRHVRSFNTRSVPWRQRVDLRAEGECYSTHDVLVIGPVHGVSRLTS